MVSARGRPCGHSGVDGKVRCACHPRHAALARPDGSSRRRRHCALAQLVVRAVLAGLRRALWVSVGLALARMRAQHSLQNPLEKQCRLPDRQLHADALSEGLARQSCAPSHQYHHRWARPRNRCNAAAGSAAPERQFPWDHRRLGLGQTHGASCLRARAPRRGDLPSRTGYTRRRAHCPDLAGDLCCHAGACPVDGVNLALDGYRAAASLWRMASRDDRCVAASGAGRECDGSSAEHANGANEPDQPVHLSEHELSP